MAAELVQSLDMEVGRSLTCLVFEKNSYMLNFLCSHVCYLILKNIVYAGITAATRKAGGKNEKKETKKAGETEESIHRSVRQIMCALRQITAAVVAAFI